MKRFIREIKPYCSLYKDANTGLAWIQDGSTGMSISIHSNIEQGGSVRGMKNMGYWTKEARTSRSHGYIYNIDTLVYDKENELEQMLLSECNCVACIERRNEIK